MPAATGLRAAAVVTATSISRAFSSVVSMVGSPLVALTSRVFTLTSSNVPPGIAHLAVAIVPLVQSSDKIMNVQARLSLRVGNAPDTGTPTQSMNALQLQPINIIL